jgi:hypothetical protein
VSHYVWVWPVTNSELTITLLGVPVTNYELIVDLLSAANDLMRYLLLFLVIVPSFA